LAKLNQAQSLLYSFSEEGAKTSKKVLEKHPKNKAEWPVRGNR